MARLLTLDGGMRVLLLCALLVVSAAEASGQCVGAGAAEADTLASPDVRIFARVRAAELRFNTEPRTSAITTGCAAADTVRVLVRTNIPDPVQSGVTYRDVEVVVEIVTRLDVVCSSALRELIGNTSAMPRLAALCALNSPNGGNRRPG